MSFHFPFQISIIAALPDSIQNAFGVKKENRQTERDYACPNQRGTWDQRSSTSNRNGDTQTPACLLGCLCMFKWQLTSLKTKPNQI